MITNVTNVLVASAAGVIKALPTPTDTKAAAIVNAGKYIIVEGANESVKIGLITNKVVTTVDPKTKMTKYLPLIKWAKEINKNAVKGAELAEYTESTPDTAVITFNNANGDDVKRILLRVTYKDMETRYRKWTETYEVVVAPETSAEDIAKAFGETLTKNAKRNRFDFNVDGAVLTLTAKEYEDDNAVDTINVSKKVRFDVNMYYTLPNADGWASKNKYAYGATYTNEDEAAEDTTSDAVILKTAGFEYQATAKLVRDREAWAMGYDGILNRGEGTWPIIKPEMNTILAHTDGSDVEYNALTIEFNNQYRAADDIVRYTRNTIELYSETVADLNEIKGIVEA